MADTQRNVTVVIKGRNQASPVLRGITRDMKGMGSQLFNLKSMAMGVFGGFMITQLVRDSVRLFGIQEQAERKLADATKTLGAYSIASMRDYKAYASEIQGMITVGDEQVLQIMQLGASLGKLTGQQLKDATIASIGLSKALGIDTTAAMRLVARAAIGDTTMLTRYGISLDKTLSVQGKFNELMKIGASNFELAKGEAETTTGKLQQFSNIMGDLKEDIGSLLGPVLVKGTEVLKKWGKQIIQGTAAVLGLTVGLKASAMIFAGIILPIVGVAKALWGVVTVQKAVASGQAVVNAMMGPAGWAQLAAGAAIATAALVGVNKAFAHFNEVSGLEASGGQADQIEINIRAYETRIKRLREKLAMGRDEWEINYGSPFRPELWKQQIAAYQAAIDEFRKPMAEKATGETDAFVVALQKQIEVFGMSANAAKLFALEQQGATQATIDLARALMGELDVLTATGQAKEFAKKLRMDLATQGMSAAEAQLYRLGLAGAEDAKLKEIAGLIGQLGAFDRTPGSGGGGGRGGGALEARFLRGGGGRPELDALVAMKQATINSERTLGRMESILDKIERDRLVVSEGGAG
ncbi:MAG TPA: hypothetical protein VM223_22465, partial [Planctomycetota bacterium]|nr:hypothetical protein [Planctomycetota bacterium]